MFEKSESAGMGLPQPLTQPRRSQWSKQNISLILVSVLLCIHLFYGIDLSSLWRCGSDGTSALLKYPGESISWEACGEADGQTFECSSIEVPLDQFNLTNSGEDVFEIPIIRLRGKHATKNLLLNPGGPGGSGMSFLRGFGGRLNRIVGDGFHLVSFDPRGVGASKPAATCYPSKSDQRKLSPVRDRDFVKDAPDMYSWSFNFAQACKDEMGRHGSFINTPQTAADMNSLLDVLGQEDMAYWGFSYGSLLGQTYAALFPERSRRVIVDGVLNQGDWYQSWFIDESFTDSDKLLDGFFDECIKAGEKCSLSELGTDSVDLKNQFLSFLDRLEHEPMHVYIDSSTYGLVTKNMIRDKVVFQAMYSSASWPDVANTLRQAMQGNATDAFLKYSGNDSEGLDMQANVFVTLNDYIGDSRRDPEGIEELLDSARLLMNTTIFGDSNALGFFQKQQWTIATTHDFVPPKKMKTAHPVLVLSTTFDPVCPLVSAKSARDTFEDSRLIEVEAYGHCSVSVASLCVAEHVRAYLYDGQLPAEDVQCKADWTYFADHPEDNELESFSVDRLEHCQKTEARQILAAQRALAEEFKPRPGFTGF